MVHTVTYNHSTRTWQIEDDKIVVANLFNTKIEAANVAEEMNVEAENRQRFLDAVDILARNDSHFSYDEAYVILQEEYRW